MAVAAGSGWEQGKKDPSKGKEQTAVCDTAALKEYGCGHHRLVARLFPTSTAPPDESRAVQDLQSRLAAPRAHSQCPATALIWEKKHPGASPKGWYWLA